MMTTSVLTPRKNEDTYNQGSPSGSPDRDKINYSIGRADK